MAFFDRSGEVIGLIFKVITVIVLLLSLLGFLASASVVLEMLVNLRLQLFVVSVAVLVFFIATRAWVWVLVIAVAVFVNGLDVLPAYAVSRHAVRGEDYKSITFFVGNVNVDNEEYDEFIGRIEYEDPDIIFLQEIHEQWQWFLGRQLADTYPHVSFHPDDDGYGRALLSKLPLMGPRIIELGGDASPCLSAQVMVLNHTMTILGVQLTSATNEERREARDEQMEELAVLVKKADDLVVVLGSVSATTWSPAMKAFVADTKLLDARKGYGVKPTWPSYFPPAQIPIDHCLLGEGIAAKSVRRGSACGSDHLPLIVEVGISGSDALERIR